VTPPFPTSDSPRRAYNSTFRIGGCRWQRAEKKMRTRPSSKGLVRGPGLAWERTSTDELASLRGRHRASIYDLAIALPTLPLVDHTRSREALQASVVLKRCETNCMAPLASDQHQMKVGGQTMLPTRVLVTFRCRRTRPELSSRSRRPRCRQGPATARRRAPQQGPTARHADQPP
jgi:hypothetical protein